MLILCCIKNKYILIIIDINVKIYIILIKMIIFMKLDGLKVKYFNINFNRKKLQLV